MPPPPPVLGHSLAGEWVGESPIPTRGHTLWYRILYMYVLCGTGRHHWGSLVSSNVVLSRSLGRIFFGGCVFFPSDTSSINAGSVRDQDTDP